MRRLLRRSSVLRDELRASSSLVILMVVSLLIVFGLTGSGVTLAHPGFQSPVDTPTPSPPAPATGTPTTVTAPTPTETEIPAVPSPEAPTPSVPPAETPSVLPISPTIEPDLTPAEGAPTPVVEEQPSGSPGGLLAISVDTCILGFSYLWLVCGALVLMLFVLGVLASFLLRRA